MSTSVNLDWTANACQISDRPSLVVRRVSVIAYDCTLTADGKTTRLQSAVESAGGQWKKVAALSEQELAGMVREDGVDILVELTGHTANNRLGVMAQRPSPIQVPPTPPLSHPITTVRSRHAIHDHTFLLLLAPLLH